MRKKTPEEMERARIAKTTRTLIRLKHALAADDEINDVVYAKLDEFDAGLVRGELKELTAGVNEVLGVDGAADD